MALLHQLPAKPPYLRVKLWRRLQAVGAVPLKNAVHLLPRTEENEAAFKLLLDEVRSSGGEAVLLDAALIAGQSDTDVRALFDAARDADYEEICAAASRFEATGPATAGDIARLRRQLAEIVTLDFFGAHGRQRAEAAVTEAERQIARHPDVSRLAPASTEARDLQQKTWVTRSDVHVDRIACAWLIRRFIDTRATFRFVDSRSYTPASGELRFDMAEAEFTHEAGRCSFETLLLRAGLETDRGLQAIGEIIHDLDLNDERFKRPETAGVSAMLAGVCASTDDDLQRITSASAALDQLHAFFSAQKGPNN